MAAYRNANGPPERAERHPHTAAEPPPNDRAAALTLAREPRPLADAVAELLGVQAATEGLLIEQLKRAWSEGWLAGHDIGYQAGRRDEAAERDQEWNDIARAALAIADPKGPEAGESVRRRLYGAVAGERRDASGHEHNFMARARQTPEGMRTDPQAGALRMRYRGGAG